MMRHFITVRYGTPRHTVIMRSELMLIWLFVCAGQWGGQKTFKFGLNEREFIHRLIRWLWDDDPLRLLNDYCVELRTVGIDVSRSYICRLFKEWGFSRKKAEHKMVCVWLAALECIALILRGSCGDAGLDYRNSNIRWKISRIMLIFVLPFNRGIGFN